MAEIPQCGHDYVEKFDPDCKSCVLNLLEHYVDIRHQRFVKLIRLGAPTVILLKDAAMLQSAVTDLINIAAGRDTSLPYGRAERLKPEEDDLDKS